MDHIHPVSRFRIALADIIIEQVVGRSRLVPLGADGQQPGRLLHHEDILVLIQEGQSFRLALLGRSVAFAQMIQLSSTPYHLLEGFVLDLDNLEFCLAAGSCKGDQVTL